MGEGRTGEPYDVPQANHRLTIAQAAVRLGISEGALRSRIKRGTMPTVKEAGRVYVVLGAGTSPANHTTNTDEPTKGLNDQSELVAQLRDEIAFLRDQVRRQQEITAQQAVTMRQLSAPSESDESTTVDQDEEEPPESTEAEEPAQRGPWWRGWFGG